MITPLAKKCSISLGRSEFFIFQHGRFNELHEGVAEKIGNYILESLRDAE